MSRYMVSWKANPSAWPTNPKQALTVIEGAIAGGDQLIKAGAAKELNWFTPQEGYVRRRRVERIGEFRAFPSNMTKLNINVFEFVRLS